MSTLTQPSDRELLFTRTFAAPRSVVWDVWTKPEHIARWWGPHGFRNTIHEMDVRPGGWWRVTMHGPDGTDYPNRMEYITVTPPERLVFHHGDDANPRRFYVTVEFLAEGERTTIRHHLRFATAAECAAIRDFASQGHASTMDRLDAMLAEATAPIGAIVSMRDFRATPEAVFAAFADPARLAEWWGPAGFTNTIEHFDLRPGGEWRLVMRGPDGQSFRNEARFVTVEPARQVGFDHLEPLHGFRMTMTFAPHRGGTRLTWRMQFADPNEAERLRSFLNVANQQNFDRLDAQLSGTSQPTLP